jgi:para-nitrobenzyl esterase
MRALLLALCLLARAVEASAPATTTTAARRRVVLTTAGLVEGVVDDAGGARWLSVPYAAPPVGPLRFRAPQAPQPWTAPRDCTSSKKRICPQLQSVRALVVGDEDCLFVNVFSPPTTSSELLPVLVFIHGGAFVLGDDTEAGLYDGARLAANATALVVTLNYRLGVLGFLSFPALLRDAGETAFNFGLQDQRAALRWVRDNAAAFGGDPARVTLFGQSAGAMAVCAHLASPVSAGLFHSAIMESGNCDSPLLWSPLDEALAQARTFAAAHGCLPADDDAAAACLRSLPLSRLMADDLSPSNGAPFAPLLAWVPVVDGAPDGVPAVPLAALSSSSHTRRVPVIVGTVKDEGSMFAALAPAVLGDAPRPLTEPQLATLLHRMYNDTTVDAMLLRYADGSPTARLSALLRDALFVCPARRVASALSRAGGDVFLYHFDYVLHWPESRLLGLGTYHASELPFVFRNHGVHVFDEQDREVEVRQACCVR